MGRPKGSGNGSKLAIGQFFGVEGFVNKTRTIKVPSKYGSDVNDRPVTFQVPQVANAMAARLVLQDDAVAIRAANYVLSSAAAAHERTRNMPTPNISDAIEALLAREASKGQNLDSLKETLAAALAKLQG